MRVMHLILKDFNSISKKISNYELVIVGGLNGNFNSNGEDVFKYFKENFIMRRVALDTETTGLNPLDGHRIVEIGCVELDGNIPTGKEWHSYLNPERSMPEAAYSVHGLGDNFLFNKPVFKDVVHDFINFIGLAVLPLQYARSGCSGARFENLCCGSSSSFLTIHHVWMTLKSN